ncbi:MAG: hypothetical protein IIB26_10820 [Chloroflexi bacterium]|nr:hypothetical protein [Chloroflexota bacterium]
MGDEELLDKKTFTGVLTKLVDGFESGAQQIRQDFQTTAMQNDPSYRELVGDGVRIDRGAAATSHDGPEAGTDEIESPAEPAPSPGFVERDDSIFRRPD